MSFAIARTDPTSPVFLAPFIEDSVPRCVFYSLRASRTLFFPVFRFFYGLESFSLRLRNLYFFAARMTPFRRVLHKR